MKILGTCFSYNQKVKEEANFLRPILSIQSLRKFLKMRNLTNERKIAIFKTLALSKIMF